MRRSLVPILIIVCAFVAFPLALREFFPLKLPAAELIAHSSPQGLTDFTFSDESGRNLTLERFRGTVVLVNVWATWCPPCKDEMASLNHLALLFANKNVKIVPISIDVSGALTRAIILPKVGLEQSFDLCGPLKERYGCTWDNRHSYDYPDRPRRTRNWSNARASEMGCT